jgi:hypothetical protein
MRFLRSLHLRQDGSPLIFGLVALAGMVIPLTAILWFTASASNSSQVAQGLSYSTAYSTMSRAFDGPNTTRPDAPGGIILRQNDPSVYADAAQAAAVTNQIASRGTVETRMELVPRSDSAPYRPLSQPLGYQPLVGIVSVPASPEGNRGLIDSQFSGVCAGGYVPNLLLNSEWASCWTDIRARDAGTDHYNKANPVAANGSRSDAWDHYTSGAEAEVAYSMNAGPLGTFRGYRRGVATYGRPCTEGDPDCSQ